MRRRQKLLVVAAALIAGNVCFFAWRFATREDDMKASWVVFMPELEASQRRNPMNFLQSSEFNDLRYAVEVTAEVGHPLVKTAFDCHAGKSFLAKYIGTMQPGAREMQPVQMPDRLFLEALTPSQQVCIRERLPKGYLLAALAKPKVAKAIGWNATDLKLSPPASTN